MKLKLLLLSFSCFTTVNLFAQPGTIAEIDKIIREMKNNLDTYEKTERADTGEVKKEFYFKAGELQVAVVQQLEKTEKNRQLFYHDKLLVYSETNWRDLRTGKILYTEKTYHSNGSLIAWLNTESSFADSSSPEFRKLDKDLNAYSIELRNEAME